jgi:hypothetical protein
MNDETTRDLERELAGLKPAAVSEHLRAAVAGGLEDAPLTLGDRILAGFMMSGALAASVIVAIVALNAATTAPVSPQRDSAEMAARQRMMTEYQALLAQR